MNIVVTGGAGFLGGKLIDALLETPQLHDGNGAAFDVTEIRSLDLRPSDRADRRVASTVGRVDDPETLAGVVDSRTAIVFHLAAVVSGEAEADLPLGVRVNLDGSRAVLEICRQLAHNPVVLFASSLAVYGGVAGRVVTDDTPVTPRSSYGVQKACAELLLADYTRRGLVRGRAVRLPTICVRSGSSNRAASSFASEIIREPLRGASAVCPVTPETRMWLLSPDAAVQALVTVSQLPAAALPVPPVLNLPGVTVELGEMVDALRREAGDAVADRVQWVRDLHVEQIVSTWPSEIDTSRARALGIAGDPDFTSLLRSYLRDHG